MYCNYSIGYVAGTAGQGWVASSKAFDALESFQQGRPSKEAMVSQFAEKAGNNRGIKVYCKNNTMYREFYNKGVNNMWYLQPIITQYFIDNKSEIWLLFLIAHSKR